MSKPFEEMTTDELIAEWHRWDDHVYKAISLGDAAAASKLKHDAEQTLSRRGLVRGVDWK